MRPRLCVLSEDKVRQTLWLYSRPCTAQASADAPAAWPASTSLQPQPQPAHRPGLAINTPRLTGRPASQTETPLRPWGRESIATVVVGRRGTSPPESSSSGGEKRLRSHSGTIGCRSRRSLGTVWDGLGTVWVRFGYGLGTAWVR